LYKFFIWIIIIRNNLKKEVKNMDKKLSTFITIGILVIGLIAVGYYFSYQKPDLVDEQGQESEESQESQQDQPSQVDEEFLVEEEVFTSVPSEVALSASVATATEKEGVDLILSANDVSSYDGRVRHTDSESDWMEWFDVFEPLSIPFNIAGTYDIQIQACNNVGCTESNVVTVVITSATE
tara:strand:- start:2448 stop:2990 length:543 start_codon:yes stop_codon:yes gene_type:complete